MFVTAGQTATLIVSESHGLRINKRFYILMKIDFFYPNVYLSLKLGECRETNTYINVALTSLIFERRKLMTGV